MTDTSVEMDGRAAGAARQPRRDSAARRVMELEAENAALRRALAEAGLAADRVGRSHDAELSRGRAGRADDALEARSAAARAEARHGREVATGRTDLASSERANGALRRANAELAASRAALREREERLRLILASATDYAIFTTDLDRRVTSWNEGAARLLGWAEEEIVGRSADAIFTPEDRGAGAPEQEAKGALRDGRAADERWHQRKDGSRFWANGLLLPLRDPDADPAARPVGFLKIMRDETGRRRAEEALHRSEARWRGVFERMHEGFALCETVHGPGGEAVDFRYLEVNAAWERLTGVPAAATVGRLAGEVFPGVEEFWVRTYARVVETGEPAHVEHRLGPVDRWFEVLAYRTEPGRFAALFLNVTERKRAEARRDALVELGDRLRDLRDPAEIAGAAAEVIGRALGADRAGYGTVDPAQEAFRVERDWTAGRVAGLAREHRLAEYWRGFAEEHGRDGAVAVGDVERDPRTAARTGAYAAAEVRALVNVPIVERGRVAAILYVHQAAPRDWTAEEVAFVRGAAERAWAASARARAEAALREGKRRLRATQDHAGVGIHEVDREGRYARVSATFTRMTGYTAADLAGRCTWDLIEDEADRQEARAAFARLVRGEIDGTAEQRPYTNKHGRRWWAEVTTTAVRDEGGRFLSAVRVLHDITERKRAEERRALLVAELNHRVKNTLAVVQSLAVQTARGAPDLPAFSSAFQARLIALARAHDLLTREDWTGAPLGAVVRAALAPLAVGRARLDLSGCASGAVLPPGAALALAMALHELATNALKHGALSVPEGRVSVACTASDAADGGSSPVVEWTERGGPPVAASPARRGFGLRLLGRGLAADGAMGADIRFEPEGVCCTLRLPPLPVGAPAKGA